MAIGKLVDVAFVVCIDRHCRVTFHHLDRKKGETSAFHKKYLARYNLQISANQFMFCFNFFLTVSVPVLDLVFAVDGSNTLTSRQFKNLKDTMKKILDSYRISRLATHVGVIEFSDNSNEKIRLTDSYDKQVIYSKIDDIEQSGGDLRVTDEALKMAANKMFSVESGGRPGASRALVVLTAGKSTGRQPLPEAITPLENRGVRIYVVSVGDKVDKKEIDSIVPQNHIFPTTPDNPQEVTLKVVKRINKDVQDRKYYIQ